MDNETITEVSEEIPTDDEAVTEDNGLDAALEAANAKAEMLEAKLLCYESGVSGGYADDVIALAKSYGGDVIVPPNKPCQKSRSIFSVVRIEKGTDLVRI